MGRKKQNIEFLMQTDWMFEKPIDREHKEYKLLSYFQKMGEKLDKLELYPGFIEFKSLPEMSFEEQEEFAKILTLSAPRIMEYFNVAKSVWSLVYDALLMKVKKNKKNISSNKGYFYYSDQDTKNKYIWEYEIKKAARRSPESKTHVNLIYSEPLNGLTINQIISKFTTWTEEEKS